MCLLFCLIQTRWGATFLAIALDALVGADARPQVLLALAADAVMLAYLRSLAFLALALGAIQRWGQIPRIPAPAPAAVMLAFEASFNAEGSSGK